MIEHILKRKRRYYYYTKRQHSNCFGIRIFSSFYLYHIFSQFLPFSFTWFRFCKSTYSIYSGSFYRSTPNISVISIEMTSFNCLFHLANSINRNSKFVMYWIWIGSYQDTEKMDFNWNVHFDQLHLKDTHTHRTNHAWDCAAIVLILMHLFDFAIRLPPFQLDVFIFLLRCFAGISRFCSFIGLRCWWQWVIYILSNRHKELLDVFFFLSFDFEYWKLYWIRP